MTPQSFQEAARKACRCGGCRQDEIGQDVLPCAVRDRIASAIERAVAEAQSGMVEAYRAPAEFWAEQVTSCVYDMPSIETRAEFKAELVRHFVGLTLQERQRCAKVAEDWADGQDRVALLKQEDAPCSAESHAESALISRRMAILIRKGPTA